MYTEQDSKLTAPKPFVFVLMPFDPAFDDIYQFGIKGAAEDIGAYAERVDKQMFDEGILDRVFNQINKADVIIADMTGRNANVFYEVGYAHALNKIVLLLTQNADDIPFDLKHRQHVIYKGNIGGLRTALAERLIWGIEEARRRSHHEVNPYRLVISLFGKEIPEISTGIPSPSFSVSDTLLSEAASRATSAYGWFQFDIRNEGPSTSDAVTHIYLFTQKEIIIDLKQPRSPVVHAELRAIQASSSDQCLLGLPVQYRIPYNLIPIPPCATERLACFYQDLNYSGEDSIMAEFYREENPNLKSQGWTSSVRFCLRLCSKNSTLNFPFRLIFDI